ncbi:hypothetical protein LSCM1_02495 [Leishmania martiniquensis]|uniref:Peptidase M14 domain-containing protein n=1 Tax=Leishmania martiniquensis TaxID=1580590 RepID=A0A836KFW4_9TRYP|nr:hypothetical protein LSCM1_02495 [Leishmania martiniquensis]
MMNLRSRIRRQSNQRAVSTATRDRDAGDGLSAPVRSCALQPRPPAGSTRSSSKGAKGEQKFSTLPAASISKRTAARRLALRSRLPYLRPIPLLPATTNGEPTSSSLRVARRSLSSHSVSREAAMAHRPSYTVIPEALQRVKQLCNSARDAEKDAQSLMKTGTGTGVRDRRASRLAPLPFTGVSEDAMTVVQDIEMVQDMLFSSLQSGSAADAVNLLAPQRESKGIHSHHARSMSWTSPRDLSFVPAGSGVFLSKKERKKAWALFLHKSTHAFALIVNACRSSWAMREPKVGSVLLSFLYNVLRHMSGDKQRKAVLLCEKLGVIRVCASVLQERKPRPRPDDVVDAAVVASLRACEAAALLFTLKSTFSFKLMATFRLSQSLEGTFACASFTFQLLEAEFAWYHASMQVDLSQATIAAASQEYTRKHTRKETLAALRRFQSRTQWTCAAFSHFCFTLFAFAGSPASAVDLGGRGAELCATAIAMCTFFLTQIAPLLLISVQCPASEQKLHPDAGPLTAIDAEQSAPSWVMRLLRRVEYMLLWCVALMQRLTSVDKVRLMATEVALRFHVPRGMALYLTPASGHVLQLRPRRECVHVMLLLLSALLGADRAATLEDMKDLGGLKGVVASVLALSETSSHQWHHFYLQLCSMYGYTVLPSRHGHPACYVDERVPASLRRSFDTAKTLGEKLRRAESTNSSARAVDRGVDAASQKCLSATQSPLDQCAGALAGIALTPLTSPSLTPASANNGVVRNNLLLVDTRPDAFSPELRSGEIDPASALAAFDSSQLPWPFTDAAPPTTADGWYGASPRVAAAAADVHLSVPLIDVSEKDRVQVLRHHIARLALLDEAACDGGPTPHRHKVVFERLSSAPPGAVGDELRAVERSADGVEFFSDYESGNLQRAVEVSDGEYDLILSWDTATNSYTQWFSFGMRRFTPGKTYRFNIVNMEKLSSTFNEGQKPLLLHVPDSATPRDPNAPRPQWIRTGEGIFYFGNPFLRPARAHYFGKHGEAASATTPSPLFMFPRPRPLPGNVCAPAPQIGGRAPPPVVAKKRVQTPSTPPVAPASPVVPPHSLTAPSESTTPKQKCYFTVTFSVTMPTTVSGTVYLANCFPFTYTELREHLTWLACEAPARSSHSLLQQCLCWTPGGVQVPLLTVTALRHRHTGEPYTADEIRRRPIALLVARVHPGETNASWVMQGLLDTLLCPPAGAAEYASHLCENFVFKVVPMLNADGVIMGNHRCSFAGADLNRDYVDPRAEHNPTLYAMKQLLRYWTGEERRQVVMFADFHGHSRAKNFLVYGCTVETIRGVAVHSRHKGHGGGRRCRTRDAPNRVPAGPEKMMAALLSQLFPSFSLSQSSFAVTKDKKGSARVVLYDEFGVRMSYGFEATMVGGMVCVPELLRASMGANGNDAAAPESAVCRQEVHYSPTVFRAMGDVFLRALSLLFQQWAVLTGSGADSAEGDRKCGESDVLKCPSLQLSWSMTAAAGGGRDPPRNPAPHSEREGWAAPPRAGPYAVATRGERRSGPPTPAGGAAAPSEGTGGLPFVSVAGQVEALDYLFMADCREGGVLAEDEDGQGEEDGSASSSDISFVEDSPDVDLEDDDLGTTNSARQKRRRAADDEEAEDATNASGLSEHSAFSSSDSTSDDQEWSDLNSFAGSATGDFDSNRSSASSVEEEIPTNLFM